MAGSKKGSSSASTTASKTSPTTTRRRSPSPKAAARSPSPRRPRQTATSAKAVAAAADTEHLEQAQPPQEPRAAKASSPSSSSSSSGSGLQLDLLCASVKSLFTPADKESAVVNGMFGLVFLVQVVLFFIDVMYWGFFLMSFMIVADTAVLAGVAGFLLGRSIGNPIRHAVTLGGVAVVLSVVVLALIYFTRDAVELWLLGPEDVRLWRFTGV